MITNVKCKPTCINTDKKNKILEIPGHRVRPGRVTGSRPGLPKPNNTGSGSGTGSMVTGSGSGTGSVKVTRLQPCLGRSDTFFDIENYFEEVNAHLVEEYESPVV